MAIKGVTIKLTDKQRSKLRNLTGEDHAEIRFEGFNTQVEKLAPKAALRNKSAMSKRASMAKKFAGKKAMSKRSPMAKKLAGKKAMSKRSPMAKKLAGRRPLKRIR